MRWKQLFKPPPGDLWINAALWTVLALYILWEIGVNRVPLLRGGMPSVSSLLLSLLAAIGYWLAQKWVRPLILLAGAALGIFLLADAALHSGFTLWRVFAIGFCIWGVWHTWHEEIPSRDADTDGKNGEDGDQPMLSLALLLREPMFMDATVVARIASKAWGADIRPASEDSSESEGGDGFVMGDESMPFFLLMYGDHGMFMIHNRSEPYFADVEVVAADCRELRTRAAVLEHTAWTAIDALGVSEMTPEAEAHAYRLVGRFLAELADESLCLAVIEPQAGMLYPYDPETEQKLLSDDPVNALREEYYAPIVTAKNEDLASAVEEARRRWPEFVAAFENRTEDSPAFLIKAPFGSDDNVEFMWVEVTAIEGDVILGILRNHPHAIPNLHEGNRVRVNLADLNDWICNIDGKPVGAFTHAILRADTPRPGEPS